MNVAPPRKHYLPNSIIIGFALFAMFFGAGNLIFPVMIGAESGSTVLEVFLGFLLTGVLLPILVMIVISTESAREITTGGIAVRIGRPAGFFFTLAVFLSTGMLYAVPRVATVAYEMSARPLIANQTVSNQSALLIFTLVFFTVVTLFLLNPGRLIGRVGGILTSLLLGFLALLVIAAIVYLPQLTPGVSTDPAPVTTGFIKGYYTMDALGAFVFGIVIVADIEQARSGYPPRTHLRHG